MEKLTGFAIVTRAEGKRVAYTHSVIDESTGTMTEDNIKSSFYALDNELLKHITAIEEYIEDNKLKEVN